MKSETIKFLAAEISEAKEKIFISSCLAAVTALEYRMDLDVIQRGMSRATESLNRALRACRLERGELSLSISNVNIHDLLEEAAGLSCEQPLSPGVTLEHTCISGDIWPLDHALILEVIRNALKNAVRSARSKVVLTAQLEGQMLLLRVEDDGTGNVIPQTPSSGSSGLGFYIDRQIARLHQRHGLSGELSIHSATHHVGTVFELRLP